MLFGRAAKSIYEKRSRTRVKFQLVQLEVNFSRSYRGQIETRMRNSLSLRAWKWKFMFFKAHTTLSLLMLALLRHISFTFAALLCCHNDASVLSSSSTVEIFHSISAFSLDWLWHRFTLSSTWWDDFSGCCNGKLLRASRFWQIIGLLSPCVCMDFNKKLSSAGRWVGKFGGNFSSCEDFSYIISCSCHF